MLTGGSIEGCEAHDAHVAKTRNADAAFLRSLRTEQAYACGHPKTWRNTQTVNGEERCRECRRERWQKGFLVSQIRILQKKVAEAKREKRDIVADIRANREEYKHRLPLEVLLDAIAARLEITVADIKGRKRWRSFVHARSLAFTILRERGLSLPRMGQLIGGLDHTSVIYSLERFEFYCEQDPRLVQAYLELRDRAEAENG